MTKRIRTAGILLFVSLCIVCAVPAFMVQSTAAEATDTAKNGWVKADGFRFYYKNGKMKTGWQTINGKKYYLKKTDGKTAPKGSALTDGWHKISGKYYYFGAKGALKTNQIVGSKKKGYYYVDSTGVRVTDSRVKSAVKFVTKNSKSSQTKKQRLKACFKAICKYEYKGFATEKPTASKMKTYAAYLFKHKKGNCYRFASAMAYIAKVLGYDARVAVGGATRYSGALADHAWCEVKSGGKWKMMDITMQRRTTKYNLFLITRAKYPYRLRCDKTYKITVKKGKVTWK